MTTFDSADTALTRVENGAFDGVVIARCRSSKNPLESRASPQEDRDSLAGSDGMKQ